mmetsp:Transcript_27259/g.59433  ORF Transcript_27259/g.59433 Transcript_27259/m.59433 type:complete len:221 (-) Transcript_27259:160-822(-)
MLIGFLHVLFLLHPRLVQLPRHVVQLDPQLSLSFIQLFDLLVDLSANLIQVRKLHLQTLLRLIQLALQLFALTAAGLGMTLQIHDARLHLLQHVLQVILPHLPHLIAMFPRSVQILLHCLIGQQQLRGQINTFLRMLLCVAERQGFKLLLQHFCLHGQVLSLAAQKLLIPIILHGSDNGENPGHLVTRQDATHRNLDQSLPLRRWKRQRLGQQLVKGGHR